MEIKPNKKEKDIAKKLQSLFDFETVVGFHIYDYGKRYCSITIEAANEVDPYVHSSKNDYGRGPNSAKVAQYARFNFPKGEHQWYSAFRGFTIPYYRAVEHFKNRGPF